jgi:DNA-binding response OmpR family regulator
MLRYTGHDAMSVQDGMEALNLLNVRRPQLILLDLNLGGVVGGFLVLESIRRDPEFSNVPIWVYSEEFSQEVIARALRAGAQEYIVKGTIGYTSLITRIDALMKKPS